MGKVVGLVVGLTVSSSDGPVDDGDVDDGLSLNVASFSAGRFDGELCRANSFEFCICTGWEPLGMFEGTAVVVFVGVSVVLVSISDGTSDGIPVGDSVGKTVGLAVISGRVGL